MVRFKFSIKIRIVFISMVKQKKKAQERHLSRTGEYFPVGFWKILSKQTTRQGAILANFYELTSALSTTRQHVFIFCFATAEPNPERRSQQHHRRRLNVKYTKKKQYEERSTKASVELFMTINILEIYDYIFFTLSW